MSEKDAPFDGWRIPKEYLSTTFTEMKDRALIELLAAMNAPPRPRYKSRYTKEQLKPLDECGCTCGEYGDPDEALDWTYEAALECAAVLIKEKFSGTASVAEILELLLNPPKVM